MNQSDRKNIRSKSESSQYKNSRRLDHSAKDKRNDDKNLNLDNYYERSKFRNNNYDDWINSPDYHPDNYYYNYDNYNDYNYDNYLNDNKSYNTLNDDKLLKDYLDRKSDLQPQKTLKEKEDELFNDYNLDDKYKINSENLDYNKSTLSPLNNYNTINGDSLNKYSLDRNNGYYDELSNLNRLEYDDYLKKNINTDDIGSRNSSDYYNDLKSYDDKDYFSKDYYNDNYYDDYKDDYKDYKDDYKDYKDDYKDYKDDYKDYRDDYKDYKDDYKDIGDSSNNYYNYTNYIYNNYFYNDGKYDDHYFDKYDTKKGNHSEFKNDVTRKLKLNALREENDIPDPKKKIKFESNIKNRNKRERNKIIIKSNNYIRKPLNDKFNETDKRKIGKTNSENTFNNYNSKTLNSRIYRAINNRSHDFVSKDIKGKSRGLSVSQKGPKNKFVIKGTKPKPPSLKDIRRREEKPKNPISISLLSYQLDNIEDSPRKNNRSVNNNMVEIKCISARPANTANIPSIINSRTKDKINDNNSNVSNVSMITISNITNVSNTSKKTIENNTLNKNNDNKNSNTNNTLSIDLNSTTKNNDNNTNNKDNNLNILSIDLNSTNKNKNNNSNDSTIKKDNDKNNNTIPEAKKTIDNNKEKNDKNTINIETTSSKSLNIPNNVVVEVNKGKKVEKIYNSVNRLNNLQNNIKRTFTKKECETCHKQIETHLFKFHSNSHPTEIFRWLYLGTFDNACDIEELKRLKVTHILNVASECKNTKLPKNIKELHLNINDYEGFEIFDYFDEANEFLNQCKEDVGIALVHCKYGISRSVAFIIAYLIKYLKFSADSALEYLLKKRSKIKPNDGFMDQLREYEREYST